MSVKYGMTADQVCCSVLGKSQTEILNDLLKVESVSGLLKTHIPKTAFITSVSFPREKGLNRTSLMPSVMASNALPSGR